MLILSRKDLAANLAAYGEHEASSRIEGLSKEDYDRIGKIGFQYSLAGKNLLLAGCLAAIEVLEGFPRELKRKRRLWDDVPSELRTPDPKMLEIHEWFEAYAGGAPVKKREIFEALASALELYLPGYRYFRSFEHFRRSFAHGISYIGFERAHGVVNLRFGVLHEDVERVKANLYGDPSYHFAHVARTISKYTANMGPSSPHWPYPVKPTWPISGTDGLQRASYELVSFVTDTVLPYVTAHEEPARIRDTFVTTPGRADQFSPSQTIFAIDYLLRDRQRLEDDYALLTERSKGYVGDYRSDLQRDFGAVVAKWNDAL